MSTAELTIGQRCQVRVDLGNGRYTDWLTAVRVDRNTVRVIARDPIWQNAYLNLRKGAGVEVRNEP
jgi:hypothetical protein